MRLPDGCGFREFLRQNGGPLGPFVSQSTSRPYLEGPPSHFEFLKRGVDQPDAGFFESLSRRDVATGQY